MPAARLVRFATAAARHPHKRAPQLHRNSKSVLKQAAHICGYSDGPNARWDSRAVHEGFCHSEDSAGAPYANTSRITSVRSGWLPDRPILVALSKLAFPRFVGPKQHPLDGPAPLRWALPPQPCPITASPSKLNRSTVPSFPYEALLNYELHTDRYLVTRPTYLWSYKRAIFSPLMKVQRFGDLTRSYFSPQARILSLCAM